MGFTVIANKPRMLASIDWRETSGVDHPANKEEGWLVMKAAGDELQKVIEQETMMVKAHDSLGRLLIASEESGFFDDVPDNVRKAVSEITDWLADEGYVEKVLPGEGSSLPGNSGYGRSQRQRRHMDGGFQTPMRRFMSKLRKLAGMDDEDVEEEVAAFEAFKTAMTAAWPDFCAAVAGIAKSTDTVLGKRAAIQKAVADLAVVVEAEMVKHGKFVHDNSVHARKVKKEDDEGNVGKCAQCGYMNKVEAKECEKCHSPLAANDRNRTQAA